MPIDGTAIISAKVRLLALGADLLSFGPASPAGEAKASRAIPAWHSCQRPESLGDKLAVLARARELLRDERGGEVLEYALIAGLIVIAAIAVIGSVGTKVLARWQSVNASM